MYLALPRRKNTEEPAARSLWLLRSETNAAKPFCVVCGVTLLSIALLVLQITTQFLCTFDSCC